MLRSDLPPLLLTLLLVLATASTSTSTGTHTYKYLLFTPQCYTTWFTSYDFFNATCLKSIIARGHSRVVVWDHCWVLRAEKYYKAAARQGHADAQYNLGALYANGLGVDISYETAREWWMKSAEQGEDSAIKGLSNNLTKLKGEQNPRSHQNPLNVQPATDHTIHQSTNSDHARDVTEFITVEKNVE